MGEMIEGPWKKKEEEKPKHEKAVTEINLEGNEWLLPSSIEVLDKAGSAFVKKLLEKGWYPDEVEDLRFGFQEALTNAIVHGNLESRNGDKTKQDILKSTGSRARQELENHPERVGLNVRVILDINENKMKVEIIDQGPGFDPKKVADPLSPEGLEKASGRGLLMMNYYFGPENIGHENISNEKGEIIGHKVTLTKERRKEGEK